jgi:Flp pilus assembly secretin CpaC
MREITSFFVKDGNTLTVGALLTDASGQTKIEHANIPVVGDLPVLGLYFRNNDKVKLLADDLIIFAAPHLVNAEGGS